MREMSLEEVKSVSGGVILEFLADGTLQVSSGFLVMWEGATYFCDFVSKGFTCVPIAEEAFNALINSTFVYNLLIR